FIYKGKTTLDSICAYRINLGDCPLEVLDIWQNQQVSRIFSIKEIVLVALSGDVDSTSLAWKALCSSRRPSKSLAARLKLGSRNARLPILEEAPPIIICSSISKSGRMRTRTFGLKFEAVCETDREFPLILAQPFEMSTPRSVCFSASHIPLFVNRLDSVETIIPYEYSRFDFCSPSNQDYAPSENLGQVVFGERIQPSAYNITFKDDKCDKACGKVYSKEDVKGEKLNFIKNGIRLNYQHH
ncbi:transmembrane 9 superfamily member 2-like, partial [Paramuricea clavata]